jgi:hypothetical protein
VVAVTGGSRCYIADRERPSAKREDTALTARVKRFAWELLGILNRLQARGSLVRIVVPRDLEVARELGFDDPDTGAVLVAQDWLEYHRFISRTDIGLSVETFTIMPEGLAWIEHSPCEQTAERRETRPQPEQHRTRAGESLT